jgi:hypothetical protein
MAVKLRGLRSGADALAIRALVLAGFPTTSTLMRRLATSFIALPWGPKILPLADSRSHARPLGRAPTNKAKQHPQSKLGVIRHGSSQEGESSILQFHFNPLQATQGWGDFQHLQDNGLIRAKHVTGRNSETELVAYLAGGTSNSHPNGRFHA